MNPALIAARRRRRQNTAPYTPAATNIVWIDSPPTMNAIGATANCRAQIVDQRGAYFPGGPSISYSSGTPADVTINSSTGLCTAVANGSSAITASATINGVLTSVMQMATVSQTVATISGPTTFSTNDSASGTSAWATYTPKDANGNTVAGASLTYGPSDANSIFQVTNSSTGAWTGQGPGAAHVTITSGGASLVVTVTVSHITYTLTATPNPIAGTTGSTYQLTVYEDTGSGPVDVTADVGTSYSIANTAIATVDAPTLGTLSPTSITQGQSNVAFTLSGCTNLRASDTITLPSGVTMSGYTVTGGGTGATFNLSATAGATTGAGTLSVSNTGHGTSGTVALTVNVSGGVTPTLTSVSQNYAAQSTTQTIVLTGTGFDSNCTAVFSNAGITVNSYGTITSTSLPVNITVAGGATTGAGTVKVHQSVGSLDSGTVAFTVNAQQARSLLYPKGTAAPALSPSSSHSSTLPLASHFNQNGGATWLSLSGSHNTGGANPYTQTTGGASSQSAFWGGFASMALCAGTIGAGTWTFKYGLYSESGASYQLAPVLYVWRPTTASVVGAVYDSATGIGSTTASPVSSTTSGKVTTFTGSSVSVQDGDMLVLEVYAIGTGSNIVHFQYDGANAITEGGNVSASAAAELDFPAAITYQV